MASLEAEKTSPWVEWHLFFLWMEIEKFILRAWQWRWCPKGEHHSFLKVPWLCRLAGLGCPASESLCWPPRSSQKGHHYLSHSLFPRHCLDAPLLLGGLVCFLIHHLATAPLCVWKSLLPGEVVDYRSTPGMKWFRGLESDGEHVLSILEEIRGKWYQYWSFLGLRLSVCKYLLA